MKCVQVNSPYESTQQGVSSHPRSPSAAAPPGDHRVHARAGRRPAAVRGGAVEASGPGEEQGAGRFPSGAGLHSGRPETPAECQVEGSSSPWRPPEPLNTANSPDRRP